MEAGYRAVALDQRGQYESPRPGRRGPYRVTELGDDVVAVGARCCRGRAAAAPVGHSFGGLVCRAAVLAEPALFDSFTLLGSGPAQLAGRRAELLEHLGPLLDAGGVQGVADTLEQLAMTDPKAQAVPEPTRAFLTERFLRNSAAGLRGMARGDDVGAGPGGRARRAGVPLLVAHGVADDAWLPEVQADMARRLGARHEVIGGSIHSPAVENPPRTVEVLLDFWGSVAARS